jgi:hypothetical protein
MVPLVPAEIYCDIAVIKLYLPRTIPDLFDLETHHSHRPFIPYVGVTVPCLFSMAVFDRLMPFSWRRF